MRGPIHTGDARLRRRWLAFSIGGLVLIGLGVSLVGEAIIRKGAGETWFPLGTLALVVLNSGVSVFGQGVVYRSTLVARDRSGR